MKRAHLALLAIAFGGFLLRAVALTGAGGPLGAPTDYDDGVYFSASALLLRGTLPYHDFVFVHPPGILYFLGLTSWMPDPGVGFAAARVLLCAVGGINILLVGLLAMRSAGPVGGIIAAALYAVYPDAVKAERSAFLEPVLNLFVLASLFVRLRGRRPLLAGFLCGVACAVKLWGGIWVIAAIASAPRERWRSDVPRFLLGGLAAGLLLLGPFVSK
ncbi:MAG: glycosyltransferase family 39 protein, partial [Thermoanaerobaculia bacterium]